MIAAVSARSAPRIARMITSVLGLLEFEAPVPGEPGESGTPELCGVDEPDDGKEGS